MAKRRKKAAPTRKAKSKTTKRRAVKRPAKRSASKKSKKPAKKLARKTARKRVSRPKRTKPRTTPVAPVVEGEIIDVVDEPVPGGVRVTEIEATSVAAPDSDDDKQE
jgi:hypothetical protein